MTYLFNKIFDGAVEAVEAAEANTSNTPTFNWNQFWNAVAQWCATIGIKIIVSIIVLIIFWKVINLVCKKISKKLEKGKADPTISRVLMTFTRVALKVILIVSIVGYLGIETSSVAAVITASGVSIGLAMQGTLSNFAGGIIIVIMRPFVLGDYIVSNGESGTVEDIKLFYTTIVTRDNRVVYIPNGALANSVIVNNSIKDTRRVEVVMSVSYNTNLDLAKNLMKKVIDNCNMVLVSEPILVEVQEFGDSGINIVSRCWVKKEDFWNCQFYLLKEYKNIFDEYNIEIPYNQIDVNFKNQIEIKK